MNDTTNAHIEKITKLWEQKQEDHRAEMRVQHDETIPRWEAYANDHPDKAACITTLIACLMDRDYEKAHVNADKALLDLIDDDIIREAFTAINKWYA